MLCQLELLDKRERGQVALGWNDRRVAQIEEGVWGVRGIGGACRGTQDIQVVDD